MIIQSGLTQSNGTIVLTTPINVNESIWVFVNGQIAFTEEDLMIVSSTEIRIIDTSSLVSTDDITVMHE